MNISPKLTTSEGLRLLKFHFFMQNYRRLTAEEIGNLMIYLTRRNFKVSVETGASIFEIVSLITSGDFKGALARVELHEKFLPGCDLGRAADLPRIAWFMTMPHLAGPDRDAILRASWPDLFPDEEEAIEISTPPPAKKAKN